MAGFVGLGSTCLRVGRRGGVASVSLSLKHINTQTNTETHTQGVYFHNCDCAAGASGGAILDPSFNVVGINTAHVMPTNPQLLRSQDYNPSYPNIAVPSSQYMPTYAHILTQMS